MVAPDKQASTFAEAQYALAYADGIQRNYWHLARSQIVLDAVRPLLRQPAELVLDVGCGRGVSVEYLRKQGIEARGCETGHPPPITAEVAPFLDLGHDAFLLPPELRHQVKVVLLLDVLEHMAEPAEFLRACVRHFPSCHHMVVTLPARMEIWSNYDEHYGHHLRYCRKTIAVLARESNLRLERSGYFFKLLYLPARMMSLLGVSRGLSGDPPKPSAYRLHELLARYFVWEAETLDARLFGSSLLGVMSVEPSALERE